MLRLLLKSEQKSSTPFFFHLILFSLLDSKFLRFVPFFLELKPEKEKRRELRKSKVKRSSG